MPESDQASFVGSFDSYRSLKQKVSDQLARIVVTYGADAGAVYLKSPENPNLFRMFAHYGFSRAYRDSVATVISGIGFGGTALALGVVRISEDIENDNRFTRPDAFKEGLRGFMSIPLVDGDETIGLMNLATAEPLDFPVDRKGEFASLGVLFGGLIHEAQKAAASDGKTLVMRKLFALENSLSNSSSVDHACRTFLDEMAGLFDLTGVLLSINSGYDKVFTMGTAGGVAGEAEVFKEYLNALLEEQSTQMLFMERAAVLPSSPLAKPFGLSGYDFLYALKLVYRGSSMGFAVFSGLNSRKDLDSFVYSQAGSALSAAISRIMATQVQQKKEVEAEYGRVARETHDSLAHSISAAANKLEFIKRAYEINPTDSDLIRDNLDDCAALLQMVQGEVRDIIGNINIRKSVSEEQLDLIEALQRQITSFKKFDPDCYIQMTIHGAENLPTTFENYVREMQILRIFQESLTNIRRHSEATRVEIELRYESGTLSLTVSDDGVGFDATASESHYGGMAIMRERAEAIGAALTVNSAPGEGATIALALPYGTEMK